MQCHYITEEVMWEIFNPLKKKGRELRTVVEEKIYGGEVRDILAEANLNNI
jgi:hypothetical protein